MANKGHIVVVGAGIVGIQTAVLLSDAGYTISIVAEYFPGDFSIDYTSPWAGGHWRGGTDGPSFEKYENSTFKYWVSLLESGNSAGLQLTPSYYYWEEKPKEDVTALSWTSLVPNFTVIPTQELPANTAYGIKYKTFCLNPHVHLQYLLSLLPPNVKTIHRKLSSLSEISNLPELANDTFVGIVNCSGLGAKFLVKDDDMYPTRGQTVLVNGQSDFDVTWVGKEDMWYIIPRADGGGTILGGCKQKGNWDPNVDDELTKRILQHTKEIAPKSLLSVENHTKFDVKSVQVGRRPSRIGGVRIEIVEDGLSDGRFLVHHYGHGGSGYQTSYGTSLEVVRLVESRPK